MNLEDILEPIKENEELKRMFLEETDCNVHENTRSNNAECEDCVYALEIRELMK